MFGPVGPLSCVKVTDFMPAAAGDTASACLGDARNFWVPGTGPMCEVFAVCLSFGDGSGTATFCFVAETWGMEFRGAALPNAGARAVKFPIHGPGRIAAGSTGI